MLSGLRRRSAVIFATVAVSVGTTFISCRNQDQLDALRKAMAGHGSRPFVFRLSTFPHAVAPAAFGSDSRTVRSNTGLRIAAERIAADASNLHVRGIALLLSDRNTDAIESLEAAVERSPRNAAVWNDVAVARAVQAQTTGDTHELARALAATDRALQLSPDAADARFNRAIILETLGFYGPAAAAWRHALDIDVQDWRDEEQLHLSRVRRTTRAQRWDSDRARLESAAVSGDVAVVKQIVATYPQQSRSWGEGQYLADWASAQSGGDVDAARKNLQTACAIGESLITLNGESLLHDAVKTIQNARTERTLQCLSFAHSSYRKARIAYRDRDIGKASLEFRKARKAFSDAGSPMVLLCDYYLSSVRFDKSEGEAALRDAQRQLRIAPDGYIALRAQLSWNVGSFSMSDGRIGEALTALSTAQTLFDSLGEVENGISMRSLSAAALSILGRECDAWNVRREILVTAADSGNPYLTQFVLTPAIETEIDANHWDIARSLIDISVTSPAANPRLRITALIERAYADIRLNLNVFRDDFASAERAIAALPDPEHRSEAEQELRFADAIHRMADDPRSSIPLLNETIIFEANKNRTVHLPAAYIARAKAKRAVGATDSAAGDLRRAIQIIERRRGALTHFELRDSFLNANVQAYLDLVSIQLDCGDNALAFATAESSKARTLLDRKGRGSSKLTSIQAALPPGHVLLHYVELPDRIVIFVVTRNSLGVHAATTTRDALLREVDALNRSTLRNLPDLREREARLFDTLIRPIEGDLLSARALIVVPDQLTRRVPLATLWDGLHHCYLIQRLPITIAPSATAFAAHVPPLTSSRGHLLAVGDPAFDSHIFPRLDRLPSARAEVHAIARDYPAAEVITSAAATPNRVLAALEVADVVHFATHAMVDLQDPLRSSLVLASSETSTGQLRLGDVANLKLLRRPIVVLAGCDTARATAGYDDLRSLSSAFLLAGCGGVIGTLWAVPDDATGEFSRRLHHLLSKGVTPGSAVRQVQLEFIAAMDERLRAPNVWGAFQAFGGFIEHNEEEKL